MQQAWGWSRACLTTAVLACGVAGAAGAQQVDGRTLGAAGQPVAGVIVQLLAGDSSVARALSAADGGFHLHAPAAGTYRLNTLRIGFRPQVTDTFTVAAGARVTHDIVLAGIAVQLAAVRVTGTGECRAGTADRAALDAWEEAKKALLASVLTRQTRALASTLVLFSQRLDANNHRVIEQAVSVRRGTSVRPFGAVRTPEDFAEHGYAEAEGKEVRYDAPDERVLLSDRFAESHCLRLAPADSGEVAVAFAPIHERDGIVEVQGTLSLDRATAELRTLDFRYTNVDQLLARAGIGGRIAFARLPDGAWLVRRWSLSLPVLGHERGAMFRAGYDKVVWIAVNGGVLTEARSGDEVLWHAKLAAVEGEVRADSTGPAVPGASITLAGTDYQATTDDLGTFVIPDVFPGSYRIGVQWPPLDSMGVVSSTQAELTVPDTGLVSVRLAVPTLERGLAIACGKKSAARGEGLVRGYVAPSATRRSAGARVRVSWHVEEHRDSSLVVREGDRSAKVDGTGRFRICGLPRATPMAVQVQRPGADTVTVTIPVDRPYVWVNLRPND